MTNVKYPLSILIVECDQDVWKYLCTVVEVCDNPIHYLFIN